MESVMQKEKLPEAFKMANLMLGKGKMTRFEGAADKIELHLSPRDYTSLVTQRTHPHDVFSMIQIDKKKQKDDEFGRKTTAVVLPKTYITRSGSLLLYSDNKIMKGKQENSQSDDKTRTLSIAGHAVPKRTKTVDAYPRWGKLVSPRSTTSLGTPWTANGKAKTSKRGRISYLQDGGSVDHQSSTEIVRAPPYSWNYAVAPLTMTNLARRDGLGTVHGLKEAILTYDYGHVTGSERYANVMCQALQSADSDDSDTCKGHGIVQFLDGHSYSYTPSHVHYQGGRDCDRSHTQNQNQRSQSRVNGHTQSKGNHSRASSYAQSPSSQSHGHMHYRKGQSPTAASTQYSRNQSPSNSKEHRQGGPSLLGDISRHQDAQKGHPTLSNWTRAWLKTDDIVEFEGGLSDYTSDRHYREPDMLALERARSNLSRQSKMYDRVPVNTPMSMVHASTQEKEKVRRRVKSSITTTQNTQSERRTPTSLMSFAENGENLSL